MGTAYSEPACQAAYDNDLFQLYQILKDDPKNLNIQDGESGDTPLIAACRRGHLKVAQYLLDHHADVTLGNKEEKQRKNVDLMKMVLNNEEVEVNAVDYNGNTGLHYACQRKSHRLIPLLLEKNADITIKNKDDETAVDIARRLKFKKVIHMLKKND